MVANEKRTTIKYKISLDSLINTISDSLMIVFLITAIMYYFVNIEYLQVRLVFLVAAGLMGALNYVYKQHVSARILGYILTAIICFFICALFDANYSYTVSKFICTFSYMGIALNIFCHDRKSKVYELLFYLVAGLVLYRIYVMKIPISRIIQDGSSYNYISINVLFFFMMASITRIAENKKISVLQSLVYLVVAISAYGRGGILSGLILIFGLVLFSTLEKSSKWKLLLLVIIGLSIVAISLYWDELLNYLLINHSAFVGKFALRGFSDSSRIELWSAFISNNKASMKGLLLGSDPGLVRVDENLHNSFLQMYSSFGVLFFLLNIVLTVITIKYYFANNHWKLLLFLVLVIRAFTDRVFYHGINECIYYYFLFDMMGTQLNSLKLERRSGAVISKLIGQEGSV